MGVCVGWGVVVSSASCGEKNTLPLRTWFAWQVHIIVWKASVNIHMPTWTELLIDVLLWIPQTEVAAPRDTSCWSAFCLLHHRGIINSISHNSSTEISLSYVPVCAEHVWIIITPGAQSREPQPSWRSSEHQAVSRHSSPFPPLPVLQCGRGTLLLS